MISPQHANRKRHVREYKVGLGAYSVEKGSKRSSRSYSRLFSLICLGSRCPCLRYHPTSIHPVQRKPMAPYHEMSNSKETSLRHSLTHSHRLLLSSALLSSLPLPLPLSSKLSKPSTTPQTMPTLLLDTLDTTEKKTPFPHRNVIPHPRSRHRHLFSPFPLKTIPQNNRHYHKRNHRLPNLGLPSSLPPFVSEIS